MHANLLTVEAAVEDLQSAVRKAQGAWQRRDHPSRYTRGRPLLLHPTQRFFQTGSPYPQHAAFRGFPGPPASPSDKISRKYYGSR
jgi:hypothetical protein